MTIKRKAKRVLKDFDFSKENHNISLVGPEVGGPANSRTVILLKSSDADVDVKKALEQVTLTLSMEEFLRKFFGMWSDDAAVLTKLLGFETEYENYKKQEDDSEGYDHGKYIEERVSQFTIMKGMNSGELAVVKASDLDEVVALQQKLEPAIVAHFTLKEKQMDELELAKSALTAKETELAAQVELAKSLGDKVAALQAELDVMKAAQEKAAFDAFADQLKGLVADEKFEQVAKGLYQLNQVDAEAATATIEAMKAKVEVAKAAEQVVAEGLTEEQGHGEKVDEADVKKAARKAAMNKAVLGQ